ncbi:MAG: GNAT family N-acetyltransferase [Clostridia bacterium]
MIATTDDYERLVPFFVANDLEFPDEEDYEVPTDLVQCWKVTEGAQPEPDEDSAEYKTDHHRLIGGFVLAERQGEFIVDGIAVDPEYRKEKLGKALLDLGIAETRKRGGKRIFLVARAPDFLENPDSSPCRGRKHQTSSSASPARSTVWTATRK